MKQLTITATILAKPGKRELVKQSLLELIPPTLKEEGCLNYNLHQDNENSDCFFFYENWASRELWLNHLASKHIVLHQRKTAGDILEVHIKELKPLPML